MDRKEIILAPPIRGVNRRLAKERQPAGTTIDMLNVVPIDCREARIRCGTRPGLVKHYESYFGVAKAPWGTLSTAVYAAPNTTLTSTAASTHFNSGVVGSSVTFITSGNSYVINAYTSEHIVVLTGNASAETGDFRVGDGYDYGDKINMLASIRHATSEAKRYFSRNILDIPTTEHRTINGPTDKYFRGEMAIKDGLKASYRCMTNTTRSLTGVPYSFIADVDNGITQAYGHSPYLWVDKATVSRKKSTTANHVRFEGTTTIPEITDLSTASAYSISTDFELMWWEKDGDPNVNIPHNQTFLVGAKMATADPDIYVNGCLIAVNIKRVERKVDLISDQGANDTDAITIRAYRIVAGVATTIKGRILVKSKGYWNVKQVLPIKVTVDGTNLSATVDGIDVDWYVAAAWGNASIDVSALSGTRFGVGCVYRTLAGNQNIDSTAKLAKYVRLPAFRSFSVAYTSSTATASYSKIKQSTFVGAGSKVYSDMATSGVFAQNAQSYNVNPDKSIMTADSLSNLYVADYGTPLQTGSITITSIASNVITGDLNLSTVTGIDKYNYGIQITTSVSGITSGFYAITNYGGSGPASFTITVSPRPGDKASGSYAATYKIARYPKKIDCTVAESSSWSPFVTTSTLNASAEGTVPYNCNIIARYRGRIVMAGNPEYPNLWYMSRVDDPIDWNYGADSEDLSRAISGNEAEAGQVGQPITAIAPFRDDACIFWGISETHVMANDPAFGGQLEKISNSVGCLGRFAWCHGPENELYFMSLNGLYVMSAVGGGLQKVSEDILPIDLQSINTGDNGNEVFLVYDHFYRGVRILIVPRNGNNGNHWFFDLTTKGFFPIQYADKDFQPNVVCRLLKDDVEDRVVFGCNDGFLRFHSRNATDDDGTQMVSNVKFIFRVPSINIQRCGILESMVVSMAEGSSPIDWSVTGAPSGEDVSRGYIQPQATGTAYPAIYTNQDGDTTSISCSRTIRPGVRGGSFLLTFSGARDAKTGTLSTAVHSGGSTTLTSSVAIFNSSMVGLTLTFITSGTGYVVASVTSTTVAVLTGNASAQTGNFYVGPQYVDNAFILDEVVATVSEVGKQRL